MLSEVLEFAKYVFLDVSLIVAFGDVRCEDADGSFEVVSDKKECNSVDCSVVGDAESFSLSAVSVNIDVSILDDDSGVLISSVDVEVTVLENSEVCLAAVLGSVVKRYVNKEDVVSGSVDVESNGGSYSEVDSSVLLVASEAEIIFVCNVSLIVACGDVMDEKADGSLEVVSNGIEFNSLDCSIGKEVTFSLSAVVSVNV